MTKTEITDRRKTIRTQLIASDRRLHRLLEMLDELHETIDRVSRHLSEEREHRARLFETEEQLDQLRAEED